MHLSTVWALNCCFWLYFAFYATYEWFEVLLVAQRVLRHAISTSKAYFDITLVALHTYTNLHTYLPIHISSYIHFYQYYILPSTHGHTWTYSSASISIRTYKHSPTYTYTSIYYTHAHVYVYTLIYIQRYYS